MRSIIGRIILKIIILIGCIGCVITKALTDQKARQVFLRNQKLSREWGLQHNLFWNSSGNAFANITYGGFTLITTLMLISRCIDAKSSPSLVEKIFLTVGMLCFCTMGGVVFSAYDQVPDDLHENAIVLGCLSFFVAFLMLIDLSDPMARHITDQTQTDLTFTNQTILPNQIPNHFPNSAIPMSHYNDKQETKEINRDNQQVILTTIDDLDRLNTNNTAQPTTPRTTTITANIHSYPNNNGLQQQQQNQISVDTIDTSNGKYIRGDAVDFVQKKILPTVQEPVFEKLLLPEKLRPHKKWIPNPKTNTSKVNYSQQHQQNITSNNIPLYHPSQQQYHQQQQQHQQQQSHQIYGRIFESTSSLPPQPSPINNKNNQPNLPHDPHHGNYGYTHQDDQNGYTNRNTNNIMTTPNIPSKEQPNNFRQYSHDNNQQQHYNNNNNNNNNQFQEKPITQYRSSSQRHQPSHRQSSNSFDNDDNDEGYQYHRRCESSNGDKKNRPTTPVQPGFVAYAAKIWDNRAKKLNPTSLNTIV